MSLASGAISLGDGTNTWAKTTTDCASTHTLTGSTGSAEITPYGASSSGQSCECGCTVNRCDFCTGETGGTVVVTVPSPICNNFAAGTYVLPWDSQINESCYWKLYTVYTSHYIQARIYNVSGDTQVLFFRAGVGLVNYHAVEFTPGGIPYECELDVDLPTIAGPNYYCPTGYPATVHLEIT